MANPLSRTPTWPASFARTISFGMEDDPPVVIEMGESSQKTAPARPEQNPTEIASLLNAVVPGLCVIREGVLQLITTERMKLKERTHLAFGEVSKCKTRLQEEMDRLKSVEKKLLEKSDVHAETAEDYEQA